MKIAVIDDSVTDFELVSEFIERYCQLYKVSAKVIPFCNGESFLENFEKNQYEIIFLDIYMGGIDGISTAQKIRLKDSDCLLIFSTNSKNHAVKSFRVRAFDYLVKPYDYSQFEEVMKLCDNALSKKSHYIQIKEGRSYVKILLSDIIYTDYSNHYIQIHTNERMIKTYMPFGEFSPLLFHYPQFLLCYRNCIINMDRIDAIEEKDFVLQNGERIPIAKKQRKEIREHYADYAFKKLNRSI